MSKIPIQVAFQGGGAKLPSLLAAADALLEAEASGKVSIIRLAGTSAGSIAASLLATRQDFLALRQYFRSSIGESIAKQMSSPTIAQMLWNSIRGKPISSFKPFGDILEENFKARRINKISDLDIETLITYTELQTSETKICDQNDDLLLSIEDSCAIPIYFRTWKSNQTKLDGGIGDNLPVNFLTTQHSSDGKILAITFSKPCGRRISNAKDFFLSIIDTAISSNEEKSLALVKHDCQFCIETQLGTFDFEKAFKEGFESEYDLIKSKVTNWINQIIEAEAINNLVRTNYWSKKNPDLLDLMNRSHDVLTNLVKKEKYCFIEVIFELFACSFRKKDESLADVAKLSIKFKVESDYLHAIRICFFDTDAETKFMSHAEYYIQDNNGGFIDTTFIPMLDKDCPDDRALGIFFNEPLEKDSGTYTLIYKESGFGLLNKLKMNGEDNFFFKPDKEKQVGPIKSVKLIAHSPEEANIKLESAQSPIIGQSLDIQDNAAKVPFPRYSSVGWECKKLSSASPDGIELKLLYNQSYS